MKASPSIDAPHFRRTYQTVIGETRIGRRDLNEEHRAHLGGLLRGQLRLLVQDLEARLPEMRQDFRATAIHVITRASGALSLSAAEARDPVHLYDMAVLVRSLLTLYQFPAHSPPLTSSARS